MLSRLTAILMLALAPLAAAAGDDLVRVESPHSVAETADRLAAAVEEAGATVFGRIPHSAAAADVGFEIPDSVLVIFGNPKMGSPVIEAAPTAGLDLPVRVVIFDDGGQTVLVYRDPQALAAAHGVPGDHEAIAKMTGALEKLTAAAAAAE